MSVLHVFFVLIRNVVADRAELVTKNLALRQQLAILEHKSKRPRLRKRDRILWAWLSRFWSNWRSRTHLSLDRNAPIPREIEPPDQGEVISTPEVGGLHHRYTRAA